MTFKATGSQTAGCKDFGLPSLEAALKRRFKSLKNLKFTYYCGLIC